VFPFRPPSMILDRLAELLSAPWFADPLRAI
jgi:hypothetical protein